MHPTALLPGGGEHVGEGSPEPKGAVTNCEGRSTHAAVLQVTQHVGPRVGGLPIPIRTRQELLGAIGFDADEHQTAQAILLETDPEVHPVGPHIHKLRAGQVAGLERGVFVVPGGDQASDR